MKTCLLFLLCLGSFTVLAQEVAPPEVKRPPAPAIAPVPPIAPGPGIPAVPAVPPLKAIAQVVEASRELALAQVKEAVDQVKVATARAQADMALDLANEGGKVFLSRGLRAGRTLIVPTKSLDPSATSALEEDLNVMARILEKAVERKSDDDGPKAMGIDVFSSSSGVRNLYLDGYGALFILKARFPLLPPPQKTEETNANESTSSTWADARSELYGPRREWSIDFGKGFHKSFGPPAEEYDADKVEKLKDTILEALKNAANIRHLKSDEKVTVVVTSNVGSADGVSRRVVSENRGARAGAYVEKYDSSRRSEGPAQSALTIQARKSDIDSFAKGKLTTQEFRKKATIVLN